MANQKTYSIIINGIKESINDIDNLLSKLDKLDNKLTQLEDKVVNVKVKENVTTTTTKQTTKSSSNTALEKEILKNEQLKNAEYQKELQLLQQIKQENKELEKLNKDIADGVRNIDGSYTNTLAGMRRQLSDMKKELSHMDIDDVDGIEEMTLQIKELNDQVKQMEADYGTFSRNVGNYTESVIEALNEFDGQMNETMGDIVEVKNGVESLKGAQMFDVNIAGQVVQFENISQAIGEIDDMAHRASVQMMELANAGKQNTEEYARLSAEFQEYINTSANLERARKYADELRDSMASTTRGLDMAVQGFQALGNVMQMANGVAGLFGQNQEEIEKAINRTVQTMAILQSAQELYQQTVQQGTFLNKAWNASLAASEAVMKMLGITTRSTTTSMKLLKGAMAATGIGLLVIAVTELVNLVYDWATGLSNVERQMVNNAQQIDRFTESTDKWMDEVKKMNDLKVELKLMTELENSDDILNKFKANYNLLVKDIQRQNTKLEGNWGELFSINTRQLDVDKKKIIQLLSTLSFEYNQAKDTVDKYKQAIADSSTELTEETIATYQNAQAKVALYESLVKVLEAQNNYNKAKDAEKEKEEQKAKERRNNRIQVEREIEDMLLSVMQDGNAKRIKELNQQKKRELQDAKNSYKDGVILLEEYKKKESAIHYTYDQKIKEEKEKFLSEVEQMNQEINQSLNEFDLENRAFNFENLINLQYNDIDEMKRALQDWGKEWNNNLSQMYNFTSSIEGSLSNMFSDLNILKETTLGIKNEFAVDELSNNLKLLASQVGSAGISLQDLKVKAEEVFGMEISPETIASIKEFITRINFGGAEVKNLYELMSKTNEFGYLFDLNISPETEQAMEDISKFYEQQIRNLKDIKSSKITDLDIQLENGEIDKDMYNLEIEALEKHFDKVIAKYDEYYSKIIKTNEKYAGEKIGLVIRLMDNEIKLETEQFNQRLLDEDKRYKELLEKVKGFEETELNQHNLSLKKKDSITKKYNDIYKRILNQHYEAVENLTMEHNNNLTNIENNANIQRSDILDTYHNTMYNEYEKYFKQVEELRAKEFNIDNVNIGNADVQTIGNFASQIAEMQRYKDAYVKTIEEIEKQQDELKQQNQDGVISEEAFNKQMTQFENLKLAAQKALEDTKLTWKEWAQISAEALASVTNMVTTTLSMLYDVQYNNEMLKIEKLQEAYEEENEMLAEKLDEQEELYDKHNQNIEDIEGELQTARGDRRLFLLDQINSEMMKREQAYNQQVKIQKQQEALEKKKEQLEQKREALEKKRNKQNQKIQIAQGLASTALSVVNALSVQPFWLGLAMSALAASMGAAQVAIISSQKFANGGLLSGKSHQQGGIPVGNTGIEVEGNEYIVNKVTTTKNLPLVEFINSKKKKLDLSDFVEFYSTKQYANGGEIPKFKYASGGQMPTIAPNVLKNNTITVRPETQQPIYVSVQEIENVQSRVRNVRVISGLEE